MATDVYDYGFRVYENSIRDKHHMLHTKHPLFEDNISYAIHNDHIRFFKPTPCYNGKIVKTYKKGGVYSVNIIADIPNGKYYDWEENDGGDVILYTKTFSEHEADR